MNLQQKIRNYLEWNQSAGQSHCRGFEVAETPEQNQKSPPFPQLPHGIAFKGSFPCEGLLVLPASEEDDLVVKIAGALQDKSEKKWSILLIPEAVSTKTHSLQPLLNFLKVEWLVLFGPSASSFFEEEWEPFLGKVHGLEGKNAVTTWSLEKLKQQPGLKRDLWNHLLLTVGT